MSNRTDAGTIIAVGSNIDPHVHVPAGLAALHQVAPIAAASRFYVTPPIDRPEQGDYWNGCVRVAWSGTDAKLKAHLLAIEAAEGRVRSADKWAARELDLDILAPGDLERDFVQQALWDLGHPGGRRHDHLVAAPWQWTP